jgi:CRISPR-associated protein Cmr1
VLLPRGAKQPTLKKNAAIQSGESATLSVACPDDAVPLLETALDLIDRYGTIGGRSRNGWGSLRLSPPDEGASLQKPGISPSLLRPWRDCLDQDWPHAIGTDEQGPLIWQTAQSFGDWKGVMQQLAALKIGLRTQFPFNSGNGAPRPEYRHWLSYPVTRHDVLLWKKKNARLPNSLRFKVRSEPDGNGLRGLIVHVPCLPPGQPFQPDRRAIEAVWAQVHSYLDQADSLTRTPD